MQEVRLSPAQDIGLSSRVCSRTLPPSSTSGRSTGHPSTPSSTPSPPASSSHTLSFSRCLLRVLDFNNKCKHSIAPLRAKLECGVVAYSVRRYLLFYFIVCFLLFFGQAERRRGRLRWNIPSSPLTSRTAASRTLTFTSSTDFRPP